MSSPSARTIIITIKSASTLSADQINRLTDGVQSAIGIDPTSVQVKEISGADRVYIGTRPDKSQRLDAIASYAHLSSEEIAARLGLSPRQVYRYRALLKAIAVERSD